MYLHIRRYKDDSQFSKYVTYCHINLHRSDLQIPILIQFHMPALPSLSKLKTPGYLPLSPYTVGQILFLAA